MGLTDDGLLVQYAYRDDDETGIVTVEARFGGFSGTSEAWFANAELLNFAHQLRTYPLGSQQFRVSGGYSSEDGGVDEHVGLAVRAVGLRGLVGVLAHLATPPDHANHGASPSDVRVEVLTSYESLGRFASDLRRLVRADLEEARLDAEVVGAG